MLVVAVSVYPIISNNIESNAYVITSNILLPVYFVITIELE